MKKPARNKKLALNHETLRVLDDSALTRAAGGFHVTTIIVVLTGSCKTDDSHSGGAGPRGSR